MIASTLLRLVLTVLFGATGLWCLTAGIRARSAGIRPPAVDRVNWFGHALMSLGMLVMVWPLGMAVPAIPQIVVFAVLAAWFAALTVRGHRPCFGHRRGRRLPHLQHAVMMGAMVWMLAAMPLVGSHAGGSGGHHHEAMGNMPMVPADTGPPAALLVVNLALGAYFLIVALGWLATAVDTGRALPASATSRFGAVESACHGGMSVGMGVMLLAML